jgi:hypothetical protein
MHRLGVDLPRIAATRRALADIEDGGALPPPVERSLRRDVHAWLRCAWEARVIRGGESDCVPLRRFVDRAAISVDDGLIEYADAARLMRLPCLPQEPPSDLAPPVTSYAAVQRQMWSRLERVSPDTAHTTSLQTTRGGMKNVFISDVPSLAHVLLRRCDSLTWPWHIARRTGEELILTREFVSALADHIRRALDSTVTSGRAEFPSTQQPATVLFLFSSGRLAACVDAALGGTARVVATHANPRSIRKAFTLDVHPTDGGALFETPPGFYSSFPLENCTVAEALARFQPAVVVVEPHADRDWTADIRACPTVLQYVLLGRLDSPAFGSTTYPWLTHGCAPGPKTFFTEDPYTPDAALASRFLDSNEKSQAQDEAFASPSAAPFEADGFERAEVPSVSRWMLHVNDTPSAAHQSTCCAYKRRIC